MLFNSFFYYENQIFVCFLSQGSGTPQLLNIYILVFYSTKPQAVFLLDILKQCIHEMSIPERLRELKTDLSHLQFYFDNRGCGSESQNAEVGKFQITTLLGFPLIFGLQPDSNYLLAFYRKCSKLNFRHLKFNELFPLRGKKTIGVVFVFGKTTQRSVAKLKARSKAMRQKFLKK